MEQLQNELENIVHEWEESGILKKDDLLVIGCSTSEVAGEKIGTAGSEAIAEEIFKAMQTLQEKTGVQLIFQCCEHLNRALVVEKETMHVYNLEQVTVIPTRDAGGAMAAYAYKHFKDPVVVETVEAHAAMDIGDTLIGMHLKRVAVPVRFKQQTLGKARVNIAKTRPKLIGGVRACYE
ncbi:MAG TPA: TIGR01440 family protein [Cerasibacillus sp.]|uniref:TIGR01440 family protein n=1 Tax=Cerasibacillus sp. TaxID=2498711 RepID=UPI002F41FA56